MYHCLHQLELADPLCARSELWDEMTDDYNSMLTKAGQSFGRYIVELGFHGLGPDDFGIDADYAAVNAVEKWSSFKWDLCDRTENLATITEEEEPEEIVTLSPMQPALADTATISNSSVTSTIHLDSFTEATTSMTTTTTISRRITWAPLPDTTKPPRKQSRSRRLRRKLGSLLGLMRLRL